MTGKPLAHSARPKRGIPAQPFWEHIERVTCAAVTSAGHATAFWSGDREAFCAEVEAAARFHDCGKLAPENQDVLARSSKDPLPIRHEDAGAAFLIGKKREMAALLVASHHAGLPSLIAERAKRLQKGTGEKYRITDAIDHTDRHLAEYAARYDEAGQSPAERTRTRKWTGMTHRIALRAWWMQTTLTRPAITERRSEEPAECRWAERAGALDRVCRALSADRSGDARNEDRRHVYEHCRNTDPRRESSRATRQSGPERRRR